MIDFIIKCDKADCNYFNSLMEGNCSKGQTCKEAMYCMSDRYSRHIQRPLTHKMPKTIDRKEEYRKETGLECKIEVSGEDCYVYTAGFIDWLIQKLDKAEADRDELIKIIKSRHCAAYLSDVLSELDAVIKRVKGE